MFWRAARGLASRGIRGAGAARVNDMEKRALRRVVGEVVECIVGAGVEMGSVGFEMVLDDGGEDWSLGFCLICLRYGMFVVIIVLMSLIMPFGGEFHEHYIPASKGYVWFVHGV